MYTPLRAARTHTGLWRLAAGRGAGSPGNDPERTEPEASASGGYTATSALSRSPGFMKVDPSPRLMLEKYSNTCAITPRLGERIGWGYGMLRVRGLLLRDVRSSVRTRKQARSAHSTLHSSAPSSRSRSRLFLSRQLPDALLVLVEGVPPLLRRQQMCSLRGFTIQRYLCSQTLLTAAR